MDKHFNQHSSFFFFSPEFSKDFIREGFFFNHLPQNTLKRMNADAQTDQNIDRKRSSRLYAALL